MGWVLVDTLTDYRVILDNNNGRHKVLLRVELTTGEIRFRIENDSVTPVDFVTTTTLSTGTQYHVAGVYNGTDLRVYINGVLDATTPPSQTGVVGDNTTNDVIIGGNGASPTTQNADGYMNDVRLYDVAYSADTIADIHARGQFI
jgi:hypothetical protein